MINEITSKNELYISLKGISINVNDKFLNIKKLIESLIELRSPARSAAFKEYINEFISELENIESALYPDKDDPDIINLINQVSQMRDIIAELAGKL